MPPPRPHATALYVAAGVGAGVVAGLLHFAVPAALEALEATGLLPAALARAAGARSSTSTTSATEEEGLAAAAGDAVGADTSPLACLAHWLSRSKVGSTAAAAVLSLAGSKTNRMASPAQTTLLRPAPSVAPPPSRLGRIAVGLPSSSPASIVVTAAPGAGRYYWKPMHVPASDPSTPGSASGRSGTGTPVRAPSSTDSELVALLRAKLAGEDPPPLTPSSARSDGEAMVPANYTGARPPLYVSPRAASADGAAGGARAVFTSQLPSPY
jgi:hypothetical protein